jgi:hypothetical protein
VGEGTLYDHGLSTVVADSTGVAIPWNVVYTTATGEAGLYQAAVTAVPNAYNNVGTPTTFTGASQYGVLRLGVSKDDLEGNLKWFATLDTQVYGSQAQADAAISANSVADFPVEVKRLEVVQVGFVVIRGSTAAITATDSLKKVAISATLAGGAANSASLITTSTTNFDGILSAADTTVQAALETVDDHSAHKGSVATGATTDFVRLGPDDDDSYRLGIVGGELVVQKKSGGTWSTTNVIGS